MQQLNQQLQQDGTLAQLVEQRTFNPFVVGSTPARPTIQYEGPVAIQGLFFCGSSFEGRTQIGARYKNEEPLPLVGAKRSQVAMNNAAITGPITNPVRPNKDMPPRVEISTT